LKTSYGPRRLQVEARARTTGGGAARLCYLGGILGLNLAVPLCSSYERLLGKRAWWDRYRDLVVRTVDYKKYDDTLRGKPTDLAAL
jgi:hypothetical protein